MATGSQPTTTLPSTPDWKDLLEEILPPQGNWSEEEYLVLPLVSAADSRRQNRFWLGADLALEVVSEEKPERDLVEKRGDYAEGRVPEYWIVNPQTETISVLRLRGDAYEEAGIYRRGEMATSGLLNGFAVAVAAVFDAA